MQQSVFIHPIDQAVRKGTDSAIRCKPRNVTGMCVTVTNGNRKLMDVGEGTVGQLLRRSGVATATTHSAVETTNHFR